MCRPRPLRPTLFSPGPARAVGTAPRAARVGSPPRRAPGSFAHCATRYGTLSGCSLRTCSVAQNAVLH
eukprot:11200154-Lingulodinium_polyedra.AAC.1